MPALRLHVPQPFRRDVFLKERGDAGVEVGAEGAERGGVAIAGWKCWALIWTVDVGVASLCHFETGNVQGQSIKHNARGMRYSTYVSVDLSSNKQTRGTLFFALAPWTRESLRLCL